MLVPGAGTVHDRCLRPPRDGRGLSARSPDRSVVLRATSSVARAVRSPQRFVLHDRQVDTTHSLVIAPPQNGSTATIPNRAYDLPRHLIGHARVVRGSIVC